MDTKLEELFAATKVLLLHWWFLLFLVRGQRMLERMLVSNNCSFWCYLYAVVNSFDQG